MKPFNEVLRQVSIRLYALMNADYSIYYPRGNYLAGGAYKEVFKVYSMEQNRLEAISVMDIKALEKIGMQGVIRQEVFHSLLLSHATEEGHLLHRKPVGLFVDEYADLGAEDGKEGLRVSLSEENERLFQYIRMELCDGGDLESFIAMHWDKSMSVATVAAPYFFQMVYSLYCAQERFHIRHCDIKLLNFLLKGIKCTICHKDPKPDVVLHYLFEDKRFVLQIPASFSYWVKLADYGTADSNPEHLGKPVTIEQFTTLENAPIEYLLEGDEAEQSYAADTFCLGLCMLQLFAGSPPYEKILEDVHCPANLLKDLNSIWMSPRKNSGFSVIKSVALDDDDEHTLCHTLYRYIVLFGLPDSNPSKCNGSVKVWQVLLQHLRPDGSSPSLFKRQSRRTKGEKEAQLLSKLQFDKDKSLFSISTGSSNAIRQCREGLQEIPGAMEVLKALVDFDPLKRPTLKQVLCHPIFSTFCLPVKHSGAPPEHVVSYYKNRNRDSALPRVP
ncbi:unnamed protein product [Hyaloperonospora brassicae]|uniref:Protein kinase domain-containing protein n=1 Tax=Hyaloperonospora brassicae TaxID=162125 RepID=A0AAV0TY22_HYABA|nr:unnamed protein product [Hyaloperonospora brassicae]